MKGVRGWFGFPSKQIFPCTFGLNEEGGMDEEEFEKYSLIQLFLFIWTWGIGQASGF